MLENGETFLTVAEVATVLRLNQQTVRNWIDAGQLPSVRVGRRVRIRRSDFDRLVTDGYNAHAATAPSGTVTGKQFWDGELPEPVTPSTD